jgi:hypothetical protein
MPTNIEREIERLDQMTTTELAERYAELHGRPTRTRHRAYLIRKIAWRLQATAEGGLSERARRRAAELADDADVRVMPPKAKDTTPGRAGAPTGQRVANVWPTFARIPIPGCLHRAPRSPANTKADRGERRLAEIDQKIAALEHEIVDPAEANSIMGNFDNVWSRLSPREQARVLSLLVDRVEFDADEGTVSTTLAPAGIKALADTQLEDAA